MNLQNTGTLYSEPLLQEHEQNQGKVEDALQWAKHKQGEVITHNSISKRK
jgi:hypothetical protein